MRTVLAVLPVLFLGASLDSAPAWAAANVSIKVVNQSGKPLTWAVGPAPADDSEAFLEKAMETWYLEVGESYTYSTSFACSSDYYSSHFAQVIWADTRYIGCAVQRTGRPSLYACNYVCTGMDFEASSTWDAERSRITVKVKPKGK